MLPKLRLFPLLTRDLAYRQSSSPSGTTFYTAKQPIRETYHLSTDALLPFPVLVDMLDGMTYNLAVLIELEYEQSREGLLVALADRAPQRLV